MAGLAHRIRCEIWDGLLKNQNTLVYVTRGINDTYEIEAVFDLEEPSHFIVHHTLSATMLEVVNDAEFHNIISELGRQIQHQADEELAKLKAEREEGYTVVVEGNI